MIFHLKKIEKKIQINLEKNKEETNKIKEYIKNNFSFYYKKIKDFFLEEIKKEFQRINKNDENCKDDKNANIKPIKLDENNQLKSIIFLIKINK